MKSTSKAYFSCLFATMINQCNMIAWDSREHHNDGHYGQLRKNITLKAEKSERESNRNKLTLYLLNWLNWIHLSGLWEPSDHENFKRSIHL